MFSKFRSYLYQRNIKMNRTFTREWFTIRNLLLLLLLSFVLRKDVKALNLGRKRLEFAKPTVIFQIRTLKYKQKEILDQKCLI